MFLNIHKLIQLEVSFTNLQTPHSELTKLLILIVKSVIGQDSQVQEIQNLRIEFTHTKCSVLEVKCTKITT